MARRVKVIEDIPEGDLEAMITVHKNDGAQVGYQKQSNGKYRLEAVFDDSKDQAGTFSSPVSGENLQNG
jgi:hypothetical protein